METVATRTSFPDNKEAAKEVGPPQAHHLQGTSGGKEKHSL